MSHRIALLFLIAATGVAWAGDTEPPKKEEPPAARELSPEDGTVTIRSTIVGGEVNEDGSVTTQGSVETILLIGRGAVVQIPYGMTQKDLEAFATEKDVPFEKISDEEWVMGLNTVHVVFKDGKVAGEKMVLPF